MALLVDFWTHEPKENLPDAASAVYTAMQHGYEMALERIEEIAFGFAPIHTPENERLYTSREIAEELLHPIMGMNIDGIYKVQGFIFDLSVGSGYSAGFQYAITDLMDLMLIREVWDKHSPHYYFLPAAYRTRWAVR